jgi:hypothetical protein
MLLTPPPSHPAEKLAAMKQITKRHKFICAIYTAALLSTAAMATVPYTAQAAANDASTSPLIITNDPLPADLRNAVYSKPMRAPTIDPAQISGDNYYGANGETEVGRKVGQLRGELFSLQSKVANLSEKLARLQLNGQTQAAEYYASVATISTQLQTGTTPGNPRLIQKLGVARGSLEELSNHVAALNDIAVKISDVASNASFILDTARATYSLTGAVEEDHVRLAQLEDAVNNTVVIIDRMLNNVNDDITRTVAYLNTERDNLRTMTAAINSGDLMGKSLSNRPFSRAQQSSTPAAKNDYSASAPAAAPSSIPGGPRPLVKIRFDRNDVDYEQPVYLALNEALTRYPSARFELIAVHPNLGNAAEVAIESTRARRNAERVLRSLTEMGLPMDRVDLSYSPSAEATTNEVHLYIH